MIFGEDRGALREMYRTAWQKQESGRPMSPLESQIASVIANHPEYRAAIEGDLEEDFTPERGETNPFLHMGLHLGLQEQITTDRPPGIAAVFRDLAARLGETHAAEHRMIDCLAETLWDAQRRNQPPDEQNYLEKLRRLGR